MKTHLHRNLILFTFIVAGFPTIRSQPTQPYGVCGQPVRCGRVQIDYPFWGLDLNRPSYCGHSGFQLTCQSGNPILIYELVNYRVLEMDTSTKTVKVARNDLWENICPESLYNSTYNSTLFDQNNLGQQDVSLYYGCNSSIPNPFGTTNTHEFECDVNGTKSDGFFIRTDQVVANAPSGLVQCENHIMVPMGSSDANRIVSVAATTDDLTSALRNGFNLHWTAYNNECDWCIRSGGRCGTNSSTSPESFACFCASGNFSFTCNNSNVSQGSSKSKTLPITFSVVGAVLVCVAIGSVIFICRRRTKTRAIKEASTGQTESKAILTINSSQEPTSDTSTFTSSIPSYASSKTSKTSKDFSKSSYFGAPVFSYEELEVATDNFNDSRELGDGGFGTVYYGKLTDGREVAVKRLYENNFKRVDQYMNEVEILSKLDHDNLVKLYGCTSKRSRELLLVYEYIPNGTVADHLHGKLADTSSSLLSWNVRLNIAIETADALAYLHEKNIIHRDVKTNNILLDKGFRVKVADFGLSRFFPHDVTHVSTAPQGTPGYVDPEYYQCYQLTEKSDVYSFGVVLVELISSLQAVDTNRHRLDINLANMAMTKIQNHMLDELVDKSIGFRTNGLVRRMTTLVAELAFRCLQQEKDMRPTMKEVVETLRGIRDNRLDDQKPEVVDIVVDDGSMLKDHSTEPPSPDIGVTDKLVKGSIPNSSDA